MAGLLDVESLEQMGLALGLLNSRKGDNWPMLLTQYAAQKRAAEDKKLRERLMQMQIEQGSQGLEQGKLQMEQMRRQQGLQDQLRSAASAAFTPPQEAAGPMPDGQSPNMLPGGGGMPDFVKRAMQIDPMEGMKYQGMLAKESPLAKIDPKDYTPDSFRAYAAGGYKDPGVLVPYRKPEGPQVGQTREVKVGGKVVTYEWNGKEWQKIADAPQWKPDADKPPAPQLYDGPQGPVWIQPPGKGTVTGAQPVIGPDNQPIPPKKRDQPLTEAQSRGTLFLGQMREAENAIKALEGKINPNSMRGQVDIALASRGSTSPLLGPAYNLAASGSAQQYNQAAEQWAEAFLRIKTGAASTKDEVIRNVRTFFPQPGDDPSTVAQKNAARAAATKQMEIIAGGGVQALDAQGTQGGATGGWGIREVKR